jgi:peptide/nickel transport system permease protein
MTSTLFGRFLQFVATLLGAATVVFVVTEILPGDPAAVILGLSATPETLAALHHDLGLDRPMIWRFLAFLGDLARGDLGESHTYRVAVASLIGERLGLTVTLALGAIGLSTLIGLPIGLAAASRAGRPFDTGSMVVVEIGLAVPSFWIGILLVLLFAVTLGWLPAGGFPGWHGDPGAIAGSLVLPIVALALPQAAILARVTRGAALGVLASDFVRAARAKGLSARVILRRHVARNALVPVVTILGLQFSSLVAGAILIENVFALPGLGRLLYQAIAAHDLVVVRALVTLFAGLVVAVNFVVDVVYRLIDPRIETEGS